MAEKIGNAFANGARFRLNESNTTFFDAGSVVFGVEEAAVNAVSLRRRGGPERDYLEGGILASGTDLSTVDVSAIFFHVLGRDRTQYIRLDYVLGAEHIDFSEFRWHWHYTPPSTDPGAPPGSYDIDACRTYHYDAAILGSDLWEWWFDRLRQRLPEMLHAAGAGGLVKGIDHDAADRALVEAQALVREREDALRLTRRR